MCGVLDRDSLEELLKIVKNSENSQKDKESFLIDYSSVLLLELLDNLYEQSQLSGFVFENWKTDFN